MMMPWNGACFTNINLLKDKNEILYALDKKHYFQILLLT